MNGKEDGMVKHPKHYQKGNPAYEPYKVIGEWGCNFNIGSAIKYLARYKSKWNPVEDHRKAKQYIDFEIEALESRGDVQTSSEGREEKRDVPDSDGDGFRVKDRTEVMKSVLGMSDSEIQRAKNLR